MNANLKKSLPPALRRRLPNPKDFLPLMQFEGPTWHPERRRLAKAANIWDLRKIAKRRTPKAPFDYTDGAAEAEISINRARDAFRSLEFQPGVLRDVAHVDIGTEILGKSARMPVGIAPTGFTRMMQTEGEYATSAAAEKFGIPFALSTMGTASVEDIATHAPTVDRWFQLYLWKDRSRSEDLVKRALAAGYETLVITVDTAVPGMRIRDVHNGMTIPPALTLKTLLDASYRPAWWVNFLTTAPLSFASLSHFNGTLEELGTSMFDPSLNWHDLDLMRERWPGKLLVKGIQTVADAEQVMEHGADGVIVSNHGGRQLDRAPIPLYVLPQVRKALGSDATIILDTGIMSGADIIAAIALGADFTLIGRAMLYGLMAGGQAGVERTLELLQAEMLRTMRLLGVHNLAELTPDLVRLPEHKMI